MNVHERVRNMSHSEMCAAYFELEWAEIEGNQERYARALELVWAIEDFLDPDPSD